MPKSYSLQIDKRPCFLDNAVSVDANTEHTTTDIPRPPTFGGHMKISKEDFVVLLKVAALIAAVVTVTLSSQCQKYNQGGKRVADIIPTNLGQPQELKLALPQPTPPTSSHTLEEDGPRFRAIDPPAPNTPLMIVPKDVFCRIPVRQQINPFITSAADGHATFDSLQFVPGVNVDGQLRSSLHVDMGARARQTMLNISLTNPVCGTVSQVYPFITRHDDGHIELDSIGFWPPMFINGNLSNIARFRYTK